MTGIPGSPRGIVDLTHPLADGAAAYPGDPGVTLSTFHEVSEAGYHVGLLQTGTHVGTHVDAPRHVDDAGIGVDRVDLRRCIGTARVIDVPGCGAGGVISAETASLELGSLRAGDRILFRTGWAEHYGRDDYFTDFPDLDLELARALAAADVALVGLEQPSVHRSLHLEVHKTLLERDVLIVEGLANLDRLPAGEVYLACLPLPFIDGDGAPCRAVAWEIE
ncbi:MAG TPA: cyclase family protein [Gaiellaceae bacterium]